MYYWLPNARLPAYHIQALKMLLKKFETGYQQTCLILIYFYSWVNIKGIKVFVSLKKESKMAKTGFREQINLKKVMNDTAGKRQQIADRLSINKVERWSEYEK